MKQIVIEIDDEVYEGVTGDTTFRDDERKALNAIRNGTVLLEHHGRLIDAKAYEQDIHKHYFDNELVIRSTEIALSNAPTIIEADTAERTDT